MKLLPHGYGAQLVALAQSMRIKLPDCPPKDRQYNFEPMNYPESEILSYAQGQVRDIVMQKEFHKLITKYHEVEDYDIERLIQKRQVMVPPPIQEEVATVLTYYNPHILLTPIITLDLVKYVAAPTGEVMYQSQVNSIVQEVSLTYDTDETIIKKVHTYVLPVVKQGGVACGNIVELETTEGALFEAQGRGYGFYPICAPYDGRIVSYYFEWLTTHGHRDTPILDQDYSDPLHYSKTVPVRMYEARQILTALQLCYPHLAISVPGDGLGVFSYIAKSLGIRYTSTEPNRVGTIARMLGLITGGTPGVPKVGRRVITVASHLSLYVDPKKWEGQVVAFDERPEEFERLGYLEVEGTNRRVWTKGIIQEFKPSLMPRSILLASTMDVVRQKMAEKSALRVLAMDEQMYTALRQINFPVDRVNTIKPNIEYFVVGYGPGEYNLWTHQDHQCFAMMYGQPTLMGQPGDNLHFKGKNYSFKYDMYIVDNLSFAHIIGADRTYRPEVVKIQTPHGAKYFSYADKPRQGLFHGMLDKRLYTFEVIDCEAYKGRFRLQLRLYSAYVGQEHVRATKTKMKD